MSGTFVCVQKVEEEKKPLIIAPTTAVNKNRTKIIYCTRRFKLFETKTNCI